MKQPIKQPVIRPSSGPPSKRWRRIPALLMMLVIGLALLNTPSSAQDAGREIVDSNCTHARDGIQDPAASRELFTEVCGSNWRNNGDFSCPYRNGFKCEGPADQNKPDGPDGPDTPEPENDDRETVGSNCTHARDGLRTSSESRELFSQVCGSEWRYNGQFVCPYRGGYKCEGPADQNKPDGPDGPDNDEYIIVGGDEFRDSSLSSEWQTPGWPGQYRPAIFDRDQCEVKDDRLHLTASLSEEGVRSCYAILNTLVGPGDGQVKIEIRANVSRMQAEGGWFAGWLQTLSTNGNPYDGNPATGTEIDIVEYVPYTGPYLYGDGRTIDYRNRYHVATHTVDGTGGISPGGNGFVDMDPLGVNLRSGDNIFSIEWNASCQIYAVNGKTVFANNEGVSAAKVHRPILSIEMNNQDSNGYNQWGFAGGNFADNLRNAPAEATVDYIRIYEKDTTDNLCG